MDDGTMISGGDMENGVEEVMKAERTAEGISLLRGIVIDEEKRCDAKNHPLLILTCFSSPIHDPVPAKILFLMLLS